MVPMLMTHNRQFENGDRVLEFRREIFIAIVAVAPSFVTPPQLGKTFHPSDLITLYELSQFR